MKIKKIIISIFSIFILLFMLSFIICSFVDVNYNINIKLPSTIKIVSPSKTDEEVAIGKEFEEIISLYNESFKENYLKAFFSGVAFKKVEGKQVNKSISNIINNAKSTGNFMLHFFYNQPQKIIINSINQTYTDIYIEVINSINLCEINAYIVLGSLNQYNLNSYAKQCNLFNYLKNI